jgi:hypothetical protein
MDAGLQADLHDCRHHPAQAPAQATCSSRGSHTHAWPGSLCDLGLWTWVNLEDANMFASSTETIGLKIRRQHRLFIHAIATASPRTHHPSHSAARLTRSHDHDGHRPQRQRTRVGDDPTRSYELHMGAGSKPYYLDGNEIEFGTMGQSAVIAGVWRWCKRPSMLSAAGRAQ